MRVGRALLDSMDLQSLDSTALPKDTAALSSTPAADLAQALLDDVRVAVTPGEAFDAPGFLRISYATSMTELERGSARIVDYLRSLEQKQRKVV